MNKEVSEFIQLHSNTPLPELALRLSNRPELPKEYILNQVNGKQKAKQKFPFLLDIKGFTFPSPRALSQSSSEQTAEYKAELLKAESVLDLSGGMGLDSYFFSKYTSTSFYVELNSDLAELSAKNFVALGANHIRVHNKSASSFLELHKEKIDLVYLDPDRRASKEKAFRIEECEPNVAELLPKIWERTEFCLIKLSPMLDISQALSELESCKEVHVVSVNQECKELLFLLQKGYSNESQIKTIHLKKEGHESFDFNLASEKNIQVNYNTPLNYLYEPNSSIMKAGAFKSLAQFYELSKLGSNTHLYTSNVLKEDFPGRKLKVLAVTKPKKNFIEKGNVVCRNFTLSPNQLRKKYKIKEGGVDFLYACELFNKQKVFIHCEAI